MEQRHQLRLLLATARDAMMEAETQVAMRLSEIRMKDEVIAIKDDQIRRLKED